MTHADLIAALLLEFSRGDGRLMRVNAGQGWTGRIVHQTSTSLTLSPYRPFHGVRKGVLDLIGWTGPGCVFTTIDAKVGRDRVRPEQQDFIDLVLAHGGRAGAARSVDEARAIVAQKNPPQ